MPDETPAALAGMGLAPDPCCHAISSLFCTCNLIWPPLHPALIAFQLDFVGLFSILLIKEVFLRLHNDAFVPPMQSRVLNQKQTLEGDAEKPQRKAIKIMQVRGTLVFRATWAWWRERFPKHPAVCFFVLFCLYFGCWKQSICYSVFKDCSIRPLRKAWILQRKGLQCEDLGSRTGWRSPEEVRDRGMRGEGISFCLAKPRWFLQAVISQRRQQVEQLFPFLQQTKMATNEIRIDIHFKIKSGRGNQ